MFLTNPRDDLAAIRRNKGRGVPGTCEWLLVQPQYTSWHIDSGTQLLQLIGGPGIGKTMLSSFLVKELEERVVKTPKTVLAYYFCDNKDEKRSTDTAVLRGLLLQLLRQLPSLLEYVEKEYEEQKDAMFKSFETLWRVFSEALQDAHGAEIYILIDALDECQPESRTNISRAIECLLASQSKRTLRLLITSRPDFEMDLPESIQLRIDSGKINADLEKFIDARVDELSREKKYTDTLTRSVKDALKDRAGGTFLWVSLVLQDLAKNRLSRLVLPKIRELPSDLNGIYDRILAQIDVEYTRDVYLTLRWVVGARRPLTMQELKNALFLDLSEGDHIPSDEDLAGLEDEISLCEPLLYHDARTDTINLYHQSVKDYLLSNHLRTHAGLSQFFIDPEMTNFRVFQTCWQYLSLVEFHHGHSIIKRVDGRLCPQKFPTSPNHVPGFLTYTVPEWEEHMLAARRVISKEYVWSPVTLDQASTLRDRWLYRVSQEGYEEMVHQLLENGSNIMVKDQYGNTAIHAAASGGHTAVVRLLIEAGLDIATQGPLGETALHEAAGQGHEAVVRLLLEKGANVAATSIGGRTALHGAARQGRAAVVQLLFEKGADLAANMCGRTALHEAAEEGHEAVVRLLLEKGADVTARNDDGRIALNLAAREGHEAVVWLLLEKETDVEAKAAHVGTALYEAAWAGHDAVVRLLLDKRANIAVKAYYKESALFLAAQDGHEAVVRLLLDNEVNVAVKATHSGTALYGAAWGGHEVVAQLLLENGADVTAQNDDGETALHRAARQGHGRMVQLLLEKGADVTAKSTDNETALNQAVRNGHEAIVHILKHVL